MIRPLPTMPQMVELTRDICAHCGRNHQALHLETGQEPVDVLIRFLDDVNRDNLFVNFDPANMILYGAGEPLPALEQLGSRVRSIHCKDATWSDRPGETWGREMPLGEGDVDFAAFLDSQAHRLRWAAHDRARNPAGAGTAEGGDRPGD